MRGEVLLYRSPISSSTPIVLEVKAQVCPLPQLAISLILGFGIVSGRW
jgi:hypothetical protein